MLRRSVESAQYTSIEFSRRCRDAGVRPSMGSVGDAYDNAMCESFFATLECELLARHQPGSLSQQYADKDRRGSSDQQDRSADALADELPGRREACG